MLKWRNCLHYLKLLYLPSWNVKTSPRSDGPNLLRCVWQFHHARNRNMFEYRWNVKKLHKCKNFEALNCKEYKKKVLKYDATRNSQKITVRSTIFLAVNFYDNAHYPKQVFEYLLMLYSYENNVFLSFS